MNNLDVIFINIMHAFLSYSLICMFIFLYQDIFREKITLRTRKSVGFTTQLMSKECLIRFEEDLDTSLQ